MIQFFHTYWQQDFITLLLKTKNSPSLLFLKDIELIESIKIVVKCPRTEKKNC